MQSKPYIKKQHAFSERHYVPISEPISGQAYTLSDLQFTADEAIKYYKEHIDEIDPEFKKSIQPIQSRDDGKDRLEIFAMKLGYPDGSPRDLMSIENWIDRELKNRLPNDDIYNIFNIRRVFGISDERPTITYSKSSKRVSKKCSKCGRAGHTKNSCPKTKKKRKRKTNYVEDISSEESSSSESESESSDSCNNHHTCYGLKKKKKKNKKKKKKKKINKKKK